MPPGLFVGRVPFAGLAAADLQDLVSCLHPEISFFKNPMPVSTDECQVAAFYGQFYSLGFSRLQFYFFECAQPSVFRSKGCHQIAAEQHDSFFARNRTRVGHIYREYQFIICGERCFIDFEIAVAERSIAETEAERPLDGDDGIVVVSSLHGVHLFAYTIVVVGKGRREARIGVRHSGARVGLA